MLAESAEDAAANQNWRQTAVLATRVGERSQVLVWMLMVSK
jgi:hypothetical protein